MLTWLLEPECFNFALDSLPLSFLSSGVSWNPLLITTEVSLCHSICTTHELTLKFLPSLF